MEVSLDRLPWHSMAEAYVDFYRRNEIFQVKSVPTKTKPLFTSSFVSLLSIFFSDPI